MDISGDLWLGTLFPDGPPQRNSTSQQIHEELTAPHLQMQGACF